MWCQFILPWHGDEGKSKRKHILVAQTNKRFSVGLFQFSFLPPCSSPLTFFLTFLSPQPRLITPTIHCKINLNSPKYFFIRIWITFCSHSYLSKLFLFLNKQASLSASSPFHLSWCWPNDIRGSSSFICQHLSIFVSFSLPYFIDFFAHPFIPCLQMFTFVSLDASPDWLEEDLLDVIC